MKHIKNFEAFLEAIGFRYSNKQEETSPVVRKPLGYGKTSADLEEEEEKLDNLDFVPEKPVEQEQPTANQPVLEPVDSVEDTRRKVIPPFGYPGVTKRSMQRKAAEERQRQQGGQQ